MARALSTALIAGVCSRAVAEDASVVGGTVARRLQSNSSCWPLPPAVSGNVSDTTSGSIIGFGGSCGGVNYNALTGEDMYLVQIPSNAPGPQGTLTVSTCGGATWDTELIVSAALVGGVCPHNQSEFACGAANDDFCGVQSQVSLTTTPGAVHAVMVTGFGSSNGAYTMFWNYALPSPTRSPSATVTPNIPSRSPNATYIPPTCYYAPSATSGVFNGTTVGGSVGFGGTCSGVTYNAATGEELILLQLPANAPAGGQLTLDTCTGTTFDTEIVVSMASGNNCPVNQGAFQCIAANDDACGVGSRVTFAATPGATYAILVTGFGTNAGNFSLRYNYAVPSPTRTPGAVATCTSLTGMSGSFLGTTVGATSSNFTGSCGTVSYSAIAGENTVLITVPAGAPAGGVLDINTCGVGTNFDTEIIVSNAVTACPSSSQPFPCMMASDDACGSGSRVTFLAAPGSTYAVLVTGWSTSSGTYNLSYAYNMISPTPSVTPTSTANFAPTCYRTNVVTAGTWSGSTEGGYVSFGGSCNGVSFSALTGENLLLVQVPATAPANGTLTLDTCTGTNFDSEIVVSGPLTGGQCPRNQSEFTCLAANDDAPGCGSGVQSRVTINTQPGNVHAVLVTGFGSAFGPYTLTYQYALPTPSRTPSPTMTPGMPSPTPSATFVPPVCYPAPSVLSGVFNGSTVGGRIGFGGTCGGVSYNSATGEELILITVPGTAPSGGQLILDTCTGTNFDTEIIVSAGAPPDGCPDNQGQFNCIASNDDACGVGSRVTISATPGSTYAVLVTGYGSNAGNFSLRYNYQLPSPTRTPGALSQCTAVSGAHGSYIGSTVGATASNFSGACGGVSYSAIAGENIILLTLPTTATDGYLTIDTCGPGTNFDTELVVSSPLVGGACPSTSGAFPCLIANDDSCGTGSRVAFYATPGSTYGILVTGYTTSSGTYNLTWTLGSGPSPTMTPTASNTPNFLPTCYNTAATPSLTGTWSGTTEGGVVHFGGSCGGVSFNALSGEELLLVAVPTFAPPNTRLQLDTCTGTNFDSELIVSGPLPGGQCPTSQAMFNCTAANDDAPGCGTGVQSRVIIDTQPGNVHAVLVTGFGSAVGPFTLRWTVFNASSTPTPSPSPTMGIPSRTPNATFVPPQCFSGGFATSGIFNGTTIGGSVGFGGSCGGVSYSATTGEDLILIGVPASAPSGGLLTVDTCLNTQFDTEIVIAAAPNNLCPVRQGDFQCIAANDDWCGVGSSVTIPATPGQAYAVLVTGYGAAAGAFSMRWNYAQPSPTRTPFAVAQCVQTSGAVGSMMGTTRGATAGFEGSCGGVTYGSLGGENMFMINIPMSAVQGGILDINTCGAGTDFDTELIVSSAIPGGVCPTGVGATANHTFPCLMSNDDSAGCGSGTANGVASRVRFYASPGSSYAVLVTGWSSSAGNYNLSWSYGVISPSPTVTPSRTPNFVPTCYSGRPGLFGSWSGTTQGSEDVGFGGTCNGVSFSQAVGEKLVIVTVPGNAPPGGSLTLHTCVGTNFDSEIIVAGPLLGNACPRTQSEFNCLASNDDYAGCGNGLQSLVVVPATPGASYAVLVTGYSTNAGAFTLSWSYGMISPSATPGLPRPPPCIRSGLVATNVTQNFTSTTSGRAGSWGGTCGGVGYGSSAGQGLVTISVPDTAPSGGNLMVSTCGSVGSFDTQLIVSGNLGSWAQGYMCPTLQSQFSCYAANDNGPAGCSPQSRVLVPTFPGATHAVIITGNNGQSGPFTLSWDYKIPPSPTSSATFRPPSATRTPNMAPPCTATLDDPIQWPSGSVTGRYSGSNEGETDGLEGFCGAVVYRPEAGQELLLLRLSRDLPAGGVLTIDTCGNTTAGVPTLDTELVVFNPLPVDKPGCPASHGDMPRCLAANDDAPLDTRCGNGLQSLVVINPALPGHTYPVLVTSYNTLSGGNYTLSYSYALPAGTNPATPTPSHSGTPTASLPPPLLTKHDVAFETALGAATGVVALALGLALAAFFFVKWRKDRKILSAKNPTIILKQSTNGDADKSAFSSGAAGAGSAADAVPEEFESPAKKSPGGDNVSSNPLRVTRTNSTNVSEERPRLDRLASARTNQSARTRVVDLDAVAGGSRAAYGPSTARME